MFWVPSSTGSKVTWLGFRKPQPDRHTANEHQENSTSMSSIDPHWLLKEQSGGFNHHIIRNGCCVKIRKIMMKKQITQVKRLGIQMSTPSRNNLEPTTGPKAWISSNSDWAVTIIEYLCKLYIRSHNHLYVLRGEKTFPLKKNKKKKNTHTHYNWFRAQ